jgi:DNA-binding phage protein
MSEPAAALKNLKRAGERGVKAETAWRNAGTELRQRVLEAQAAGVPISRIADAAGLSRQGIYYVLRQNGRQRPS